MERFLNQTKFYLLVFILLSNATALAGEPLHSPSASSVPSQSISCDDHSFSVPNAFSPNGDNNNDQFCLQGWTPCVLKFRVVIFNRWGEQVFESKDPDFCWDGTFRGAKLDADVYMYAMAGSSIDGKVVEKKGNITLLR